MRPYSIALFAACLLLVPAVAQAGIEKSAWGETADHQKIYLYTLHNAHGLSVSISTFGGTSRLAAQSGQHRGAMAGAQVFGGEAL